MTQFLPNDETGTDDPRTTSDLRSWVRARLDLSDPDEAQLFQAIDQVVGRQRQLLEESKREAIRAMSEGFAAKMERLQRQLTEKDVTVSNIARYFEEVVAELTEKSHRDPKTKLLNFDWFMERVESFLAVEQRVRWCGVGVVDISSFKWYNDTLG
ncbi:MAG: GGDEF domain-containing protein, partial [Acidobacteria bacterium]|nr:GGDEF domain-containing protein [Acidobacteriota bacterium]